MRGLVGGCQRDCAVGITGKKAYEIHEEKVVVVRHRGMIEEGGLVGPSSVLEGEGLGVQIRILGTCSNASAWRLECSWLSRSNQSGPIPAVN
jgi:hypothetical protein